jgi:hypothetical protein
MKEIQQDDTLNAKTHSIKFTEKNAKEHFISFSKMFPARLPKLVTIFCSTWAVMEIINNEKTIEFNKEIIPVLVLTIVISFYDNYKAYREKIPLALKDENNEIKKMYIKQKIGWEYKIVYIMLKERTLENELRLERVKMGAEFIIPKIVGEEEYIVFIKTLPTTILRLVEAAKITCIDVLPDAIVKEDNIGESDFEKIKKEIDNLNEIYKEAVDFEMKIYEYIPPSGYERIHELMMGWTDPIRDGINQFIALLKVLSEITKKQLKEKKGQIQEMKIVFNVPSNIEPFNEELKKVTQE